MTWTGAPGPQRPASFILSQATVDDVARLARGLVRERCGVLMATARHTDVGIGGGGAGALSSPVAVTATMARRRGQSRR
jgi:hypothetical protein